MLTIIDKETFDYLSKHQLIDKFLLDFCYYNSNSLTLNEAYNSFKEHNNCYKSNSNQNSNSKQNEGMISI
jgi:hypothetical protein